MLSATEQLEIISKGAHTIIHETELLQLLENSIKSNKPLNIKLGLDPTAPDIHLGHTVVLRKIRQMQDLGHNATIILGDFTGRIGDPTGKSKTRKQLSHDEVIENAKTYKNQIFKVLDLDKTTIRFNSEWLSKLNFEQVLKLASSVTIARILERDDFNNRFKNNEPIGLHELFYPLMQGYDSLAIDADIEMGGTEQTFNILMGRTLQKSNGKQQQSAIFMPILEGVDGIEKMSKSLGNYIGINESADIIFQKVMRIPDHLIIRYFTLVTDLSLDQINAIEKRLSHSDTNPRDVKMQLAREITKLYHSEKDTQNAENTFKTIFQKRQIPENIDECIINDSFILNNQLDLIKLITSNNLVKSSSDARRLIQQNAIKIDGVKINTFSIPLPTDSFILQVGKGKFLKLIIKR